MEEIVRKWRKDKYIANQKIEIGETFVERPELTAPITTKDGSTGHKRMPLKCFKNVKRVLSKLHRRRKKLNYNVYTTLLYKSLCISLYFKVYKNDQINKIHTFPPFIILLKSEKYDMLRFEYKVDLPARSRSHVLY